MLSIFGDEIITHHKLAEHAPPDLGQHFGGLLYEREANFLRRTEWAGASDDVPQRRTTHHRHLSSEQRDAFGASRQRVA